MTLLIHDCCKISKTSLIHMSWESGPCVCGAEGTMQFTGAHLFTMQDLPAQLVQLKHFTIALLFLSIKASPRIGNIFYYFHLPFP